MMKTVNIQSISHQRGMSFVGLMLTGTIVFFMAIILVKTLPAYIEYASVKKLMYKIGHEPNFETMTNEDIAKAFDEGANISYISSVKSSDLTIYETDQKIVAAEYQVEKPLIGNMSLMFKFKATTEH